MGGKFMYLLVLVVVMICGSSTSNAGVVHKVGESCNGTWTNLNHSPSCYKDWAASKHFQVGDTILFEYIKEFHDVVRVTHNDFNACISTAPYATWATGNDSFTITRPGHYFFICSKMGHCQAGQKVDIRVLPQDNKNSSGPSPSPTPHSSGPSPSPHSSGPTVISASPSQPPKKSASSSSLNSDFKLWLCVVLVAIGFAALGF